MNSIACSSDILIGVVSTIASSVPDARMLVSCLPFRQLTVRSLGTAVNTNDLAFINFGRMFDKQTATFLQVKQSEAQCFTCRVEISTPF